MTKEFHIKLAAWLLAALVLFLLTVVGLGLISFIAWKLPWEWEWNAASRTGLVLYWIVCISPSVLAGACFAEHQIQKLKKRGD